MKGLLKLFFSSMLHYLIATLMRGKASAWNSHTSLKLISFCPVDSTPGQLPNQSSQVDNTPGQAASSSARTTRRRQASVVPETPLEDEAQVNAQEQEVTESRTKVQALLIDEECILIPIS
jgi:hypothetical protein